MTQPTPLQRPFTTMSVLVREHAAQRPAQRALMHGERVLDYAGLDAAMDRIAAALARDGVRPGEAIAICAASSIEYAAVYLGAVRAGVVVAPLAPSSTPDSLAGMIADAGARFVFTDASADVLAPVRARLAGTPVITLDDSDAGRPYTDWLAPAGTPVTEPEIRPELPLNIIYSSGTTGAPKGIVQSHGMRWAHVSRGAATGYGTHAVTLLSTPLYSNTTLASFFPTIGLGGTAILMAKFDAAQYLALAQQHRVTHTMLVPVQYQRLLAHPAFDQHDLSAFRHKFCTSAPCSPTLKAEILRRWPGALTELYGMTEGGGGCLLFADQFPHKLHTVGRPATGADVRIIDEDGRELPPGSTGEVVGRSAAMMNGYHNQPEKTAETEWHDAQGQRFIRTGDIGRFDEDGFLVLLDRKKDMIISGGFNIYPSDLEAVVREHPAVSEVSVVGVPSERWGETPVAFVALRADGGASAQEVLAWANERLGKTQRLAQIHEVESLPRSAIGKVLKRELRDRVAAA
ncbi:putative AMP-dependent synthetase and ligase [Cupriavidus phytorum]|uniref:AMP-dependent synthetase and ligase n=2 Tax=Cupriavidus TaxID=106589 RepID=A0A976A4W4_9BURK|nr:MULTISPECIES: class I adenylate-forming enzyme family protein [Cupriavidus]PZX32320.1 acyl-CoA synthetase (AMP-forming)/AMP-acid ligase II [Cupriavidus alkaliphilus]SOY61840.1 putative AMP-dependent synthetase and ligase [Cupriavidus taiwanensis]